jgi:hypothetical protein
MAEVLVQVPFDVHSGDGRAFQPQICGRQREDRLWEGWIEFAEKGAPFVLRTSRETTQSNRDLMMYWATGLSSAYLEGALERALRLLTQPPLPRATPAPYFDEPAAERFAAPSHSPVVPARAVLDPFAVYAEGDGLLRSQLGALDAGKLRDIVRAYAFQSPSSTPLESMTKPDLIALIMEGVKQRGPSS